MKKRKTSLITSYVSSLYGEEIRVESYDDTQGWDYRLITKSGKVIMPTGNGGTLKGILNKILTIGEKVQYHFSF